MGDSPGQPRNGSPDKIRRNVACISCRDSKVRCRASPVAGQPCQRCAKLHLSCVYDKSHRRVTKRSKLELLEQELRSIKQVVNPPVGGEASWSPPTPRTSNAASASTAPMQLPEPAPAVFGKSVPTEPRTLGSLAFSGEDVDWYFDRYFQCFHPYVPVLRKRDPDECYRANPTLFWAVIYVASRRYAKDDHCFAALVEHVTRDVAAIMASAAIDLEAIHAMLLICAWPFPTIRFVCDPSTTMINVALTACMLLGLHLGCASHPEFCIGGRKHMGYTAAEAASTWIACCTLAQTISSASGLPPPSLQQHDAQCKRVLKETLSSELMTLFELEKFLNRLHTTMAGYVAVHGGVFESMAKAWEEDFEALKPIVTRVDSDCSRFMILSAQLEVQAYYFAAPSVTATASPPHSLSLNTRRVWNTARETISLALALESRSKFLTHGPHWIFRAIVDASCILMSTLHSAYAPNMTADEADAVAQQINTAGRYCVVRDGDLPCRAALILEAFWSVRNLLPKSPWPALATSNRVGGAVTFWCLNRFKDALQQAKKSTDGVGKGLEAFPPEPVSAETNGMQEPVVAGASDPFQDVDWSMFMDDLGWTADGPVFLGPTSPS